MILKTHDVSGFRDSRSALILSIAVVLASACASNKPEFSGASEHADGTMWFQTRHAASAIANCLDTRLSHVRRVDNLDRIDVYIDGDAWHLMLEPNRHGAVLTGQRGPGGDAIEPEVRFAIARCAL